VKEGQIVDLISHIEGEERVARHFVVVPYKIPRRSAATYSPEANVLVPVGSVTDKSNKPASKSVIITIKLSEDGEEGWRSLNTSRQTWGRSKGFAIPVPEGPNVYRLRACYDSSQPH